MQTEHKITAVLGPTNTGKTHLAIERMLGHRTGMIGCPLRLLAREIYDKVAAVKGPTKVALITGEEKIIPQNPRFYICTTESMPTDKLVDFLAVDEIQLAADPERGHVFTDRILHARGLGETMFLGSSTIEPMIRAVMPRTEIISRPRFSKLTYSGEKKLTRLRPRTAIVTFSASEVYLMAESIRRLRGGSAVVLGALSPRTRNAQVEMFEDGEVDYLIATDAIGMGLNLDVHHVAFAQLKKFDGRRRRSLTAAEIAQIAGRAGRYSRDGTFGSTAGAGAISDEIISSVEEHEFPALTHIYWRNRELRFESVDLLLNSLEENPASPFLLKPHNAEDIRALRALIIDPVVKAKATSRDSISLLWEVCRIPDFQQILSDAHFQLLKEIFLQLSGPTAKLPDDWVQKMSKRLDQTAGDIETLAGRIAHIRTWNYIAHRPDWVSDPSALQNTTRQIEDRLSDALHERLTQRFVDKKTRAIVKGYDASGQDSVMMKPEGSLSVASENVGKIEGINFILGDERTSPRTAILENTIREAVSSKLRQQVDFLCQSNNREFTLGSNYIINWRGGPAGRLQAGKSILKPKITAMNNEMLDGQMRVRIQQRLQSWWDEYLSSIFRPLFRVMNGASSGPSRAIAFRLLEQLGNTPRDECQTLIDTLTPKEIDLFNKSNVRFGRLNLFIPTMLKTPVICLRDRLWQLYWGTKITAPKSGRVTMRIAQGVNSDYYWSIGYQPLGRLALRVDILERLGAKLRQKFRSGPFELDPTLISLVGTSKTGLDQILSQLGYHQIDGSGLVRCFDDEGINSVKDNALIHRNRYAYVAIPKKVAKKKQKTEGPKITHNPKTSPFAVLQNIKFPKK